MWNDDASGGEPDVQPLKPQCQCASGPQPILCFEKISKGIRGKSCAAVIGAVLTHSRRHSFHCKLLNTSYALRLTNAELRRPRNWPDQSVQICPRDGEALRSKSFV